MGYSYLVQISVYFLSNMSYTSTSLDDLKIRSANTDATCRAYRLTLKANDTEEPQFGIYWSEWYTSVRLSIAHQATVFAEPQFIVPKRPVLVDPSHSSSRSL